MFYRFLKVIFLKVDDILPKSSDIIRRWIIQVFELRKQRLKESFKKCQSNINFSFDLWTSLNHKALLRVIAYYIDENRVLQSVS